MKIKLSFFILTLLICISDQQMISNKNSLYRRVCVYPNWSVLRPIAIAKMFPENIDPNICTHIHYAYANINVRTLELVPSLKQDVLDGDHGAPLYERIMKLRELNPNLKILISIGGYYARSTSFDQIVSNEIKRKKFVLNAVKFLKKWNFDGIDIQWEYPGDGAALNSRERFTSLLKSLNLAFKQNSKQYLLSIFASSDEAQIDVGYQVKQICQYLDYLTVETYDYTGVYDKKTAYNSPLYSRSQLQNSVNKSINHWIERGCHNSKILVGISTYAKAFKILNKPNMTIYYDTEADPYISTSSYTLEDSTLSYFELCELMQNQETKTYWDQKAQTSFAIIKIKESKPAKNDFKSLPYSLWITYEDAKSARKKAEYVKNNTLGGVTFWTIDMDDFRGSFCKIEPFPILESVREELENKLIYIGKDKNSIPTIKTFKIETTKITTTSTTTAKISQKNTKLIVRIKELSKNITSLAITTPASTQNPFNMLLQAKKYKHKVKLVRALKLTACIGSNCNNNANIICSMFNLNLLLGLFSSYLL